MYFDVTTNNYFDVMTTHLDGNAETALASEDEREDAAVDDTDRMRKLYIEPTSRCNLRCSMCFRNTWFDEEFADMEPAVFDAVLDTMPKSVEVIFFGGMGEPLTHPGLPDMIARAVATGKKVQMVTNVMLLTPEISKRLVKMKLDQLWVSVDAFDRHGYESIRRNGTFAHLDNNLAAFNKWKQMYSPDTRLGINFVAMKDNIEQLKVLPQFVSRYNVSEVNVSNLIPSDQDSESRALYTRVLRLEDGRAIELPATAPEHGQADDDMPIIHLTLMDNWYDNVTESIASLSENFPGRVDLVAGPGFSLTQQCRFIDENNCFVRHDGEVSPCMGLLHNHTTHWLDRKRTIHRHSFGNVLNTGLRAIWASQPYREFRERVRTFAFSPCMRCAGCDLWDENVSDCFGNEKPVCGACLWSAGVVRCP